MSQVKTLYGTEAQGITITLASLANGAARQSAAVDNTVNVYLDALLFVQIDLADGGTIGSDKRVYVYAAGTVDLAGSLWPYQINGTDAAVATGGGGAGVLVSPPNIRLVGVIECADYLTASRTVFGMDPVSIGQAFGGLVPEKWSIIVENKTNMAFRASETNQKKEYQGQYAQTV